MKAQSVWLIYILSQIEEIEGKEKETVHDCDRPGTLYRQGTTDRPTFGIVV